MRRNHSIIACSRHIYIWVLFVVHIPFVVNCTFNATPTEVATTSSWCCIFWKMDRFDHRSYETSKGFSRPEVCTNLTLRKDNSPIIRIRLCSLAILLWRGSGRGMVAQAGADIGILVAMVVCCGVVVWVGRCAVVAMAVDYVGPDLDFEVPELVLVLFLFSILRRRNLSWSSSLFLFLILSRRTSSWSSSLFLSLFSGAATCPGPLLVWILNRFPHFVVIGKPSKASHCGSKQHAMITLRVC